MINFAKKAAFQLYKNMEIKDHPLLYLFLEITRKCNLNCLHCGSDCKSESSASELTTGSWKKIISYVKDNFGTNVSLIITGGEPLLHPDLEKIGKHISSLGMKWGMVTNGMALSKTKLEKLLDAGLTSITVSLDGMEESHNLLRNHKNSYKTVYSALKMLGSSDIEIKDVVTCVHPSNLEELDSVAKNLIEAGIHDWRLFRIFPNGRAKDSNLLLTYDETWKMLQWIKERKPHYKKKGLNINYSCEGYLPFKEDRAVRDFPFFCRAGVNFASILCDGTITGCSNNHSGFTQGNILKDDFREVWEKRFDDLRKREWLRNTVCSECKSFKECRGSSIHLWEYGKKKPNFCYVKNLESDLNP